MPLPAFLPVLTPLFPPPLRVCRRLRPPTCLQDPYKELDIPPTADAATIKRAYRRAALKNHPDVSGASDARERFQRVQEAYSTLSNPQSRAAYDATRRTNGAPRETGFDWERARKWRVENPMPEDLDDSLGSILSDLFSGGRGVADDLLSFLERRSGGGLADDLEVLKIEVEDARFVMGQLKERAARARKDIEGVCERVEEWGRRERRAEERREYEVRRAAGERKRELEMEVFRLEERARRAEGQMRRVKERVGEIEGKMREIEERNQGKEREGGDMSRDVSGEVRSRKREEAVDEELEKMKHELGL